MRKVVAVAFKQNREKHVNKQRRGVYVSPATAAEKCWTYEERAASAAGYAGFSKRDICGGVELLHATAEQHRNNISHAAAHLNLI